MFYPKHTTAPVHFLVIPRKTIRQIADVTNEDEQVRALD